MDSATVEPKSGKKVKSLYATHADAVRRAENMLRKHGPESQEFFEADRAATVAWRRVQAAIGIADQNLPE